MTAEKLRHHGGKMSLRLRTNETPAGESVRGDARTPAGVKVISNMVYASTIVSSFGGKARGTVAAWGGGVE